MTAPQSSRPPVLGVCFFDVDGTLTDAPRLRSDDGAATRSEPVQACLEAGFAVGVATASTRRWQDVCTPSGHARGQEAWATDDLCGALAAEGFTTFNSRAQLAGAPVASLLPEQEAQFRAVSRAGRPGLTKAWAMEHVRRGHFPQLSKASLLLFDNEPQWVEDARRAGVAAFCVNPGGMDVCQPPQDPGGGDHDGSRRPIAAGVPFSGMDARGVQETLATLLTTPRGP